MYAVRKKEHTMKTNHGILEAKSRKRLAGFAVLLVAAIFTMTGCSADDDGDDLPPINEQTTGVPKVEVKDVKLAGAGASKVTIVPQTIGEGYGTWSVTNGVLALTLDTPIADVDLQTSTDWLSNEEDGGRFFGSTDTDGDDAVKTDDKDGNVNIASQSFFPSPAYYIERLKAENDDAAYVKSSNIVYIYVSKDITLSRGKVMIPDYCATYSAFNLPLKQGWNLMQSDLNVPTGKDGTVTIKIADKDVPWTVYPGGKD
jgi:hypothetical protein